MPGQLFGNWLSKTAELQRESYGYDPCIDTEFDTWIEYVRNQTLAAFVELGEFLQELVWKPWAKTKRLPNINEREKAIGEIVDVLHFVANALYALNVSDDELNELYEGKMTVNRKRMASGGH